MQTFDPRKRLTVGEALEHPYVSAYVCLVVLISELTLTDAYRPSTILMMNQPLHHWIQTTLILTVSTIAATSNPWL